MSVRRFNFKKTDVPVTCRSCGKTIPNGSRCVTLITTESEKILVTTGDDSWEDFLDAAGATMKIRRLRGRAPYIECELVCEDAGIKADFFKKPKIEFVHWEKCGVESSAEFVILPGSFGSRKG